MTAYHLKHWQKIGDAVEIKRIYVNAEDRSTLGYFEMRVSLAARGADSAYDRHRLAKGDDVVETGRVYSCTVPAAAVAALFADPAIAGAVAEQRMDDDFARFHALLQHARGVNWIASGAQARELKRKARFTIELEPAS